MGDLRELVLLSLESVGISSRLIAADSLFARPFSIISSLPAGSSLANDDPLNVSRLENKNPLDLLLASRLAAEILQEPLALIDIKDKESGLKRNQKQIKCAEEPLQDVMDIWSKPYGWFFLPGEKIPLVK